MVSTGQEPQITNQEPSVYRPPKLRQQWHAINILLLIALLGLFLLSFGLVSNYEAGIQRLYFPVGDHPVLEMRPNGADSHFVAIVAHGFAGSKDLMSTFGTELAHAGITTYLVDFPGYGDSSTPADLNSPSEEMKSNVETLSEVINNIRTLPNKTTPTPVATSTQVVAPTTPTTQPQNDNAMSAPNTATAQPQNTSQPSNTPTTQPQATPQPTTPLPQETPQVTEPTSPKIILIGYSMGAAVVNNYLAATYQKESEQKDDEPKVTDDIIATVLISPTGQDMPTKDLPRNVLILAGQNDFAEVLGNSDQMYENACGSEKAPRPECGKVDEGTARRITILPGLTHTTILNANGTFQEMLNWLHRVEPQITVTNMHADSRMLGLVFGALCVILALFPLCSLLIDIFGIHATSIVTRSSEIFLFFLSLLLGIAIALAIQSVWRPLNFIHLAISNYVTGYFFIIAMTMALLLLITRRRFPLPPRSQLAQQILAGVIPALLLYFTLGQLTTFTWQRITLNWPRLIDFVIIAVLIFPLFLIEEGIIRGYQQKNMLHTIIGDLIFKALLLGGLLVVPFFVPPWGNTEPSLNYLTVIMPVLAFLMIILSTICTQFYHSGRAALAGAIFSTLIMAWFLSTTFPII